MLQLTSANVLVDFVLLKIKEVKNYPVIHGAQNTNIFLAETTLLFCSRASCMNGSGKGRHQGKAKNGFAHFRIQ